MAYGDWKFSSRPRSPLPLEARRSKRWREMMELGTYSKSGYDLSPTELTKFMELLNLQMWDLKRLAEDFRLTPEAAEEVVALLDKPGRHTWHILLGTKSPTVLNQKKGDREIPVRDPVYGAQLLLKNAPNLTDEAIASATGLSVQHVASLRS
jgi:hypothetical protein